MTFKVSSLVEIVNPSLGRTWPIWVGRGTGYLLAMTGVWILGHPIKTISYSKGNFRALGSISDPPARDLVAPRASPRP